MLRGGGEATFCSSGIEKGPIDVNALKNPDLEALWDETQRAE